MTRPLFHHPSPGYADVANCTGAVLTDAVSCYATVPTYAAGDYVITVGVGGGARRGEGGGHGSVRFLSSINVLVSPHIDRSMCASPSQRICLTRSTSPPFLP